jgi:hypothetical protein
MANIFTYQVIKDTTEHAVIKLTGRFDGTNGQEDNASRIAANTLYGALDANSVPLRTALSVSNTALPYYGLSVNRLWYDTLNSTNADVEVFWSSANNETLMLLSGNGEYDGAGNWVTLPNSEVGTPGCNGNIGIRTRGMGANNSYTIVLELRKDNHHYQRGQFNDPAAFNFGIYSTTPR